MTQNISINTNRKIPLVLTKKVIDKITEWCRNLPNNEWSGVLFYNIEGNINEDNFKITTPNDLERFKLIVGGIC